MVDQAAGNNEPAVQRGASIDIGTNSVKVWVADVNASTYPETVHEEIKITKLGEHLSETGHLSENAMKRTLKTAGTFARTAERNGAERTVVGTTSAVRKASNQEAFLERGREEWGLDIQVLSGEQEARCTFIGVTYDWENESDRLSVFDVGGGSTELIHGPKNRPDFQTSVPIGSVQLYENMNWSGTVNEPELKQGINLVAERIQTSLSTTEQSKLTETDHVIGVGGTVATLAQVHMNADAFIRDRIEKYEIRSDQLFQTTLNIASHTPSERVEDLHIKPGRKEYIIGGAVVVAGVLEGLNAPGLQCTCRGLRHGLFINEYLL